MGVLTGLQPQEFFDYFEEISAIPRGSYHEKEISDFLKKFAEDRGMTVYQDEYYNLLIKKKGTKGYENAQPILFHGHMDMVLDKEDWVSQDMLTEGIRLVVDGDYIRADGTTLGADNGVGVAFMMCVLGASDLPHPPIECIISVQEEVGKRGGIVFNPKNVTGKRLMDFNWHKPDTVFAGCAGDISAYYKIPISFERSTDEFVFLNLSLSGGKGGHSEFDIHLERVNALVTYGRIVNRISLESEVRLVKLDGGINRYVIPGNMESVIGIKKEDVDKVKTIVSEVTQEIKNEYKIADPDIKISLTSVESPKTMMSFSDTKKICKSLHLMPCGVKSMSLEIPGLVESSNTVAMVETNDNEVRILSTIPSAVTSRKYNILQEMCDLADLVGAEVETFADCPEWPYKPDSALLATAKKAFKDLYGYEPEVEVSHSSLELGLFHKKIPGLEMISLGPVAYDVHMTSERLKWTTVQMVWDHIKEILKNLND
ncbi:MAG: beta-Ala-His dipeptidase [Suipraeoptans sp.]